MPPIFSEKFLAGGGAGPVEASKRRKFGTAPDFAETYE